MKKSGCLYDAQANEVMLEVCGVSRTQALSDLSANHYLFPTSHIYVANRVFYALLRWTGLLCPYLNHLYKGVDVKQYEKTHHRTCKK